jgi:cellulose biosynthesis protein BcsQ
VVVVIIMVANLKGGSGKSFLVSLLALSAAATSKRVAVIDVDPQASTTRLLTGRDGVVSEEIVPNPITVASGRITVYPSNPLLEEQSWVYEHPERLVYAYVATLKEAARNDIVLIDTPSAWYPFTLSSAKALLLRAVETRVIMPVSRGPWTITGALRAYRLLSSTGLRARFYTVINNVYSRELRIVESNVLRALSSFSRTCRIYVPRRVGLEDATAAPIELNMFARLVSKKYPEVYAAANEILKCVTS